MYTVTKEKKKLYDVETVVYGLSYKETITDISDQREFVERMAEKFNSENLDPRQLLEAVRKEIDR